MPLQIQFCDNDVATDISAQIEKKLLASLAASSEQGQNRSFSLSVYDKHERLIGGLTASTSYGWILIKTLWVEEAWRRTGLGRKLVANAEERARELTCHGVWLDTSSIEARQFYEALGYAEFGQLKNFTGQAPKNHHRWFMRKEL